MKKFKRPAKILPGVGLGDIHFGWRRKQLIDRLGEPTSIEEYHDGNGEYFDYDHLYLSFSFSQDSCWRLDNIRAERGAMVCIKGSDINLITRDNARPLMQKISCQNEHVDETLTLPPFKDTHLRCDSCGIGFFFKEDGVLDAVSWSIVFDENDNYIWPNKA